MKFALYLISRGLEFGGLIFGGKFVLVIRGAYIRGAYIRGGLYSGFYGTYNDYNHKEGSTVSRIGLRPSGFWWEKSGENKTTN